jgi:hypothetical protein
MGVWPELDDDDAMRFEFPSASSRPVRGSIFKSSEHGILLHVRRECCMFVFYEARNGTTWQATSESDGVLYSTIVYLNRL